NTLTDGQTAEVVVTFNTDTNLTIVGWDYATLGQQIGVQPFPLPNAVITGSYGPIQLIATHGVPIGTNDDGYGQYSWSSVPMIGLAPTTGLSLHSGSPHTPAQSGTIDGSAAFLFSQSIIFTVMDSLPTPNQ